MESGKMSLNLTLAVTSYNRAHILDNWLKNNANLGYPVLIIDNGSVDNTFEVAQKYKVKVIRNEYSRGFYDGWTSLFEHCETRFLVVLSDEDDFVPSNMIDMDDSVFISTRFRHDDVTRGNKSGRIQPHELFLSSFYISGLVYETAPSLTAVQTFKPLADNFYWQTYPQTAMLLLLLAERPGYWDCNEICVLRERVPSEPPVVTSLLYYSPEGRRKLWHDWQEIVDFAIEQRPDLTEIFNSMRFQQNMDNWRNC